MTEKIDKIIERNRQLTVKMEQCFPGDMATLCKIQQELKRNNKEILEWANNMGRISRYE
jgi:hypothetical protein